MVGPSARLPVVSLLHSLQWLRFLAKHSEPSNKSTSTCWLLSRSEGRVILGNARFARASRIRKVLQTFLNNNHVMTKVQRAGHTAPSTRIDTANGWPRFLGFSNSTGFRLLDWCTRYLINVSIQAICGAQPVTLTSA
eukprot:5177778-Amphidinium_carterae.1